MLSPLESAERILVIRDISVRRQTERLKDEFVRDRGAMSCARR